MSAWAATGSPPAAPVPRMFAAIAWQADEIRPLLEAQTVLRGAPGADAWRWTLPDDLHLTLRFHGDANQAQADAVAEELARQAQAGPLAPVRFEHFATWPGVLVARFVAPPALQALQAQLERHAIAQGFAAESRSWSPHVTLARTPREHGVELPKLKLAPFELPVARLVLACRADGGPARYARLATFELPAGSGPC